MTDKDIKASMNDLLAGRNSTGAIKKLDRMLPLPRNNFDFQSRKGSEKQNFPISISQQSYKSKNNTFASKSRNDLTQTHSIQKLPQLVHDGSEIYSQLDMSRNGRERVKVP